MSAYATAEDVQAVAGRTLSTEEVALVERRLAQVERKILRRIPDLADQIDSGNIDQADVVDIEAEAVLRLIRNPEGYASESDGTYSYQFNRETASGKLEILAEEWNASASSRVGCSLSFRTSGVPGESPQPGDRDHQGFPGDSEPRGRLRRQQTHPSGPDRNARPCGGPTDQFNGER